MARLRTRFVFPEPPFWPATVSTDISSPRNVWSARMYSRHALIIKRLRPCSAVPPNGGAPERTGGYPPERSDPPQHCCLCANASALSVAYLSLPTIRRALDDTRVRPHVGISALSPYHTTAVILVFPRVRTCNRSILRSLLRLPEGMSDALRKAPRLRTLASPKPLQFRATTRF